MKQSCTAKAAQWTHLARHVDDLFGSQGMWRLVPSVTHTTSNYKSDMDAEFVSTRESLMHVHKYQICPRIAFDARHWSHKKQCRQCTGTVDSHDLRTSLKSPSNFLHCTLTVQVRKNISVSDFINKCVNDNDNDNDTLREVPHLSMRAWPYRQERRGHGPTKKDLS